MQMDVTLKQCPACKEPLVLVDGRYAPATEGAKLTIWLDDDQTRVTPHDPRCEWFEKAPPSAWEVAAP